MGAKNCEKKEWVREYKSISYSQVYARDLNSNVIKTPFNLWCSAQPFDIGICNSGLFLADSSHDHLFIINLATNRLWELQPPKCYNFNKD